MPGVIFMELFTMILAFVGRLRLWLRRYIFVSVLTFVILTDILPGQCARLFGGVLMLIGHLQ